jgi:hypothetical protein
MARISFIPFVGILGMGAAVSLAGCGASSGTIGSGVASELGGARAGSSTQSANAGGTVGGASAPLGNNGWVLAAPKSIFGFPQVDASAEVLSKVQGELSTQSAAIGVSGTPVIAFYDDPTHDAYLIFAGYNGSGYDPARLESAFQKLPVHTRDGAGDNIVINDVTIDPGPHGGGAGCQSTLIEDSGMAAEGTLCSWLTPTTLGSITYYPKADHSKLVTGTGPEVMGKVMRDLRDLVEHRG